MDMPFHCLRCSENQKQFSTYWHAGATNLADYVTKHHPAIHHQSICFIYLTQPANLLDLWHKVHNTLKLSAVVSIAMYGLINNKQGLNGPIGLGTEPHQVLHALQQAYECF
eukprot:CCRYP_020489-RA/>CCRYP_020489-RA protein AED:0.62 eAED:0.62 QI:0/-1/0/1/-1/0/1/0/110